MRNVFISKESFVTDIAPKEDAICFTSNPFANKSYVLYESGLVIGINSTTNEVDFECDVSVILADMIEVQQHFFFISFMTEMERLLLVTREGLIMTLNEMEEIEPVGDIEGGILACCWTNDQEVLLIVTTTGSLVLLNNSFELLNESHLDDLDSSEPVSISWRSDGEFVAINYKCSQKRCIRIFTKELQNTATSRSLTEEMASGIQMPLSWNPDHSLIATVQEEKRKTLVSFYERNGLRHGEFVLPPSMTDIQLSYNSTGTLIAVTGVLEGTPVVQLWTRMNYHWYLKLQREYHLPIQSVYWDPLNEMVLNVVFMDGSINSLLLKWNVTNSSDFWNMNCVLDGETVYLNSYNYAITPPPLYTHSLKLEELKSGIVSAFFSSPLTTDSETPIPTLYLITNHSLVICEPTAGKEGIPTPRQFHTILTSYKVNKVIPLPDQHFYSTGVHLCSNLVSIVFHDTQSSGLLFIDTATEQFTSKNLDVCEILPIDSTSLLVEDSMNSLSILHVECDDEGAFETILSPLSTLSCFCEQLFVCHSPEFHYLGLSSSGHLFYDNHLLSNNIISCSLVSIYCTYIVNDVIPKLCFIPLHQLPAFTSYVNPTTAVPINPNFSRSLERGSFLVGSGSDGRMTVQLPRGNLETFYPRLLSCNHIEQLMYEKEPKWKEIVELMRRQRIPLDLLYDIDPSYFLSHVESFIKSQLNEDRINLFLSNLSDEDFTAEGHDYYQMFTQREKPVQWVKRQAICSSFLPVLKTVGYVEASVTCLCTFDPPRYEDALFFLKDIIKKEDKPVVLNTVETVGEEVEDTEEPVEAETDSLGLKGMKWLLILVEPSIVYNVALGTYDLELTELVALLSQQDPREFKPYLTHLKELPISLRQYEIDKQIKRWNGLMKDIGILLQEDQMSSDCPGKEELFNEATSLLNDRGMVKEYLESITPTQFANAAHHSIADYFMNNQKYAEALQHYLVVNPTPLTEILNVCMLLGNSHIYLLEVFENVKEKEEQVKLIKKLCSHLRNGNTTEIEKAASIYIEYLQDEEEAVVCLCSIQQFIQAIGVAHQFDREDLIETVVLPKLQEFYQSSLELMKEKREKLDRVVTRLTAIHEEKQKKEMVEEINDNESVWSQSTNASAMTGISAISGMTSFFQDSADGNSSLLNVTPVASLAELSKRADNTDIHAKRSVKVMRFGKDVQVEKKEKKRKMKIRAGSPQEEEALMKMVELITDVKELKREIMGMIECLLVVHENNNAQQLQKEFHVFLDATIAARNTLKMEVNEKEREEALVYSWLECFVCLRIEWLTDTQNSIQPL